MKKILLFGLLLAALFPLAHAEEITVAAAADLNYALKDIASRYQHKTGEKVTLSFGSSGNFFSQIQSGAPYDIFFSADMEYPRKLASAGLLEPSSLRTYAIGDLVLWYRNGLNTGQPRTPREDIIAILQLP